MKRTQKIIAGISSTALALGLTGCGNEFDQTAQQPEPDEVPNDASCADWEWDSEDGVWECDDTRSPYYGHFLYGGLFYNSKSMLKNSAPYKNYKNSSSYKGSSGKKGSTGFGSGSRSSGS